MTRSRHFASEDIKDKCEELKEAWAELLEHSQNRKTKLDFSLQKQAVSIITLYSFNCLKFYTYQ